MRLLRAVLVLLSAVLFSACAAAPEPPPSLDGEGSKVSPQQQGRSSRVATELLALVESPSGNEATADGPEPSIRAGSPVNVRDGRVLVDCAAEGDPQALAAALAELGMTETEVFKRVVSGWLPIEAIGQLEELEGLRLARPTAAQTHSQSNPTPPGVER